MKNKYKAFAITCLTLFGITLLSGCTKDDISDLKEEVSNLQSQINDLQSQISTLQNQMKNEIQSVKDEYNPQIETLKNQISSLNEELTALKTNLESAKKELQENLNKNIHELRTHIDEEVSKLQNQITQNENELSSLKTKHDQDVLALKSDYEKKISSLQEDVDNKKTELEKDYNDKLGVLETTYNTKVQSIQNDIDACNASIASFKETYKQEKQSLEDDYNNKINALKEEYQNKVSSIESSISSLEDSLSTLREEMNTLIANIQKDYNDKIDGLVTRVGNLENVTYYTITFDANGGEGTFTSQKIAKGDTITKPADPRKDGYDFDGWYTSLDEKWSFSGNVVTRDMTLTARYLPHTYTIHIDFGDGTYNEKNSYTLSAPYLSDYSLPTPTYYGHRFAGYVDQNKKAIPLTGNYSFTEDLELSTNWDPLYVLTLDSDGGTSYEPIAKYDYNPIESLPTPTKDGATFQGWYLGETKIEFPYTPTSFESFTLKAKWRYASDTFTYEFFNNDEEVKITGYLAKEANVEVPETINNKPVTLIGAQAFQNNTSIESIDLSSNISDFEEGALNGCSSLQELMVSKTSYNLIKAFSYDESNVPESFKKMKFKTNFENSNKLLNGLKEKRFEIQIGKDVSAFCFENSLLIEKVTFEKGWNFNRIPGYAFSGCEKLSECIIPDCVEILEDYCFNNATSVGQIHLPSKLKEIQCFSLPFQETIRLPEGIETIERGCLWACFVTLPKSIKTIEEGAFYGGPLIKIFYEGTKADWYNINFPKSSSIIDEIVFESKDYAIREEKNGLSYYRITNGEIYLRSFWNSKRNYADFEKEFEDYKITGWSDLNGFVVDDPDPRVFRGLRAIKTPSYMNKISNSFVKNVCHSTCYLAISEGTVEIEGEAFEEIETIEIPTSVKKIGKMRSNPYEIRFLGTEEEWKQIDNDNEFSETHVSFNCSPTDSFEEKDDCLLAVCRDGSANIIECLKNQESALSFDNILTEYHHLAIMPFSFQGRCSVSKGIKFDNRITYIGTRSFGDCESGDVIIPESVPFVSSSAFNYVSIFCERTNLPSDWFNSPMAPFSNGNWHWYSETSNTDGQHWRYVDGKPTIWTD